jgi:methyltransferase (TIGR00027 family)
MPSRVEAGSTQEPTMLLAYDKTGLTEMKEERVTDTLIENVSDTAFWIAHYRAVETERTDALFRDPLAGLLAGDRGKQIARAMPKGAMTGWAVVIRTCIIDDYIRSAVAGGVDAILNLGAGLDTRPYRMELPESLVWVEADYPGIVEFKEKRLSDQKPRCRLERVKLDLGDLPERRRMFASANARANKMLVLTEGVVPYLTVEDVGRLADDLRTLDGARYWVVDYLSPKILKYRQRLMRRKVQNAPFKFNPKDWFEFFGEHGWRCREIRYLAEEGDRLHRPIRLPLLSMMVWSIRGLFASSEKRAGFRRLAGYVLLEPGTKPEQATKQDGGLV